MRKIIFLLMLLLSLCIVGCTNVQKPDITEEEKEQVAEKFLREIFLFNNDDRYSILMEKLSSPAMLDAEENLQETLQLAYDEYYKVFEGMVTESCVDTMIKNRYPMQYEKLLVEAGEVVEIDNIHFEAVDEDTYTYEVSFKENKVFDSTIKGSVILFVENDQVLVDVFMIY